MATINLLEKTAIEHASREFARYIKQVEQVKHDISLMKMGQMKLTDISRNKERIKARIDREKNILREVDHPVEMLERVIANPDFQEACILARLVDFANTVGRIIRSDGAFGTGWLVGENLLITNQHVLPDISTASSAQVNMGYERSVKGVLDNGENYRLRPDLFFMTPPEPKDADDEFLDFTIVAVEEKSNTGKPLSDYGHVVLDGEVGKVLEGENCMVIQHPEGNYKKVVLRDIRLLVIEDAPTADAHLFYESDTLPGSSGGMVLALGTGEIIALHNAGVPRRDDAGRYLKKDGTVWQHGEPDNEIDWIANQGVRVSRMVKAIRSLPIPSSMEGKRKELVNLMDKREYSVVKSPDKLTTTTEKNKTAEPAKQVKPNLVSAINTVNKKEFVVKISGGTRSREFVSLMIKDRFPDAGVDSFIELNESTSLTEFLMVSFSSNEDPWKLASQLEELEGIEEADPELPRFTTMVSNEDQLNSAGDFVPFALAESSKQLDEEGMGRKYKSTYFKKTDSDSATGKAKIRRWNHTAVNFDPAKIIASLDKQGVLNLQNIRIAQFDTGYVDHSKTKNGFNTLLDYDYVHGDDDSMDEQSWFRLLRHYAHGLRTGSLLIGNSDSQVPDEKDGNAGLVRTISELAGFGFSIVPFRVTRSVILVRRIAEVVRAADMAITSGYDIITMSLGILPGTRALQFIVRQAYEKGVIWCSAAGNEVRLVVAPGKYPGTICIAASNPEDRPWSGSCRGTTVDITAPGEDIYVPVFDSRGENMKYGNGTSYATPHVAAAAAFWFSKHKEELLNKYIQGWQKVEAFRYCMQRSAKKINTLGPEFGKGLLDIQALLEIPLPDPALLKHAYLIQKETFSESSTLAQREETYKAWQTVFSVTPGSASDTSLEIMEITAGKGIHTRRRATEIYSGLVSSENMIPSLQESSLAFHRDTPLEAFERIKMMEAEQVAIKPEYD